VNVFDDILEVGGMGFPGVVLCFGTYVFGVVCLRVAVNSGLMSVHTHGVLQMILDLFGDGFLLWLTVAMLAVQIEIWKNRRNKRRGNRQNS
jgi:threonine/homoserine/homoserine lactone efflux protein